MHGENLKAIPEQLTGKARHQETTRNSHIGHCTHSLGSENVKVQNIFHGRNNITCSTDCKYRTAATLCTLNTSTRLCYRCVIVTVTVT